MIAALDRTLLGQVSGFIAERTGLHFPEERWSDLARGLRTAGQELGFEYPGACLRWLMTRELTTRQIETLASHLTVVGREILPPLAARRSEAGRTLRVWSAGCCTGEEAYSLAITCARALPDLRAWNVSILATDINPRFLAKAAAGVYSEWSFRGVPGWLCERFFSPAPDKKFAIDPAVQNLVQFGYLNLAEDAYPSLHNHTNAMDVIFCRNVFMYFTPGHQRRVAAALHRCLVEGGYLLVNPAEASASLFPMFAMENIGGVILFRKASPPGRVAPIPAIPPSPPEDPLAEARTCANQGRLQEALTSCQNVIAADRTNLAAHFLHAAICDELGRLEEAIAALGKVLYLDQDFILAHHALGGLYKRLGKQKESRRHLVVALQLLAARSRDEIVPESDGMTCGRLVESVRTMTAA